MKRLALLPLVLLAGCSSVEPSETNLTGSLAIQLQCAMGAGEVKAKQIDATNPNHYLIVTEDNALFLLPKENCALIIQR